MGTNLRRVSLGIGYFALPTALYAIFVFGGLFLVLQESLGYIPAFGLTDLHLNHYAAVFALPNFWKHTAFSLYIALASAAASTALGVWLAQHLLFRPPSLGGRLTHIVSHLLMILPYLYMVFLVIWMFSDSGLVARIFHALHLPYGGVLYDPWGLGIVATFTLKGTPFVTVYVYSVMRKIRREYLTLGQSMGLDNRQIIPSVYVPLCSGAIVWVSVVLFAYALGSYEVPTLLTTVRQTTLAQMMYRLYTSRDYLDVPLAMALALVTFVLNIVAGGLYALALNAVLKRKVPR